MRWGQDLRREHTPDKFTSHKAKMIELIRLFQNPGFFSRRRPAEARQAQGFQPQVAWEAHERACAKGRAYTLLYLEQQAEKAAGDSGLFKGKTDTKATLGLFVSETPCTLKTSHSFVLSKHQGLMQPACPLHPPAKASVTGQVLQSCPSGTHNAGG